MACQPAGTQVGVRTPTIGIATESTDLILIMVVGMDILRNGSTTMKFVRLTWAGPGMSLTFTGMTAVGAMIVRDVTTVNMWAYNTPTT